MPFIPGPYLDKIEQALKLQGPWDEALKAIEEIRGFEANPALRQEARDQYGSDDIEIDEDASCSRGADDGTWVQAWVWVADGDEDVFEG